MLGKLVFVIIQFSVDAPLPMIDSLECYLCYQEGTEENPFALDPKPCNCKGGIVIHKACLRDLICHVGDKCLICQTEYNHKAHNIVNEEGYILSISRHNKIQYKENEYGQKHGLYIEYYGNTDIIKRKYNYVNGKRDGMYESWHENGQKQSQIPSINRIGEGVYESWYSNGQMKSRCSYRNQKAHGTCELWYINGQIQRRMNYTDGKRDGLDIEWYGVGTMKYKSNYIGGKREGVTETWYCNPNHQMKSRSNYVNGNLHGISETWHMEGKIQSRSNYVNGKRHGLCETWHWNGNMATQCNYRNGFFHGICKTWYENNQLVMRFNCHNGILEGLYETWCYWNGRHTEISYYCNGKYDSLRQIWCEYGSMSYSMYIDGIRNGISEFWDNRGTKRRQCTYINGKYDGVYKGWDMDGNLEHKIMYRDGEYYGMYMNWLIGNSYHYYNEGGKFYEYYN